MRLVVIFNLRLLNQLLFFWRSYDGTTGKIQNALLSPNGLDLMVEAGAQVVAGTVNDYVTQRGLWHFSQARPFGPIEEYAMDSLQWANLAGDRGKPDSPHACGLYRVFDTKHLFP
jgi:hypothetical protein